MTTKRPLHVGVVAARMAESVTTRRRVGEMLENGLSVNEIARELGRNRDSVIRSMRRWGLIIPTITKASEEQRALVIRLVEDGVPFTWIAETIGQKTLKKEAPWLKEALATRERKGHSPSDWQKIWPQIRRDPRMLKMHHSIAPHNSSKGTRPES